MRKSHLFLAASLVAVAPLAAQAPASAPAAVGTAPAAGGTAPAAAPNVTVGAQVSDASGGAVGTVSQVAGGNATIDTGTAKAAIPMSSFAQGPNGLVIGMTKAQLEAAVAAAKPAEIATGNKVVGPKGNPVGTVTAAAGDLVTVQTSTTKVQLPKKAFAQNPDGTLVIGMTQEQLDAAAKAAGGGTPG